jgi:hypothetical protein
MGLQELEDYDEVLTKLLDTRPPEPVLSLYASSPGCTS